MRQRRLLILAVVVVLVVVVVLTGGLPEGRFGTGSEAPGWIEGVGELFGPRRLRSEDLGGGSVCSPALASALDGEGSLALTTGASCVLAVPLADGLLVRPRGVSLRVEAGSLAMSVVQRGKGNSLVMDESFQVGEEASTSFGKRGGTVRLTCPGGCVLSFPR